MDNMGGSAPPPPPPPPSEGEGSRGFAPRGIGDILSTAFDLYKRNAAQLLIIAAVVVVPLTLIQAVLTDALVDDVVSEISVNEETGEISVTDGGSSFGQAILASVLLGLISAAIWMLLTGALTRGAAGALSGRPIDVGESYRAALSRLAGLIGLSLLIAIVVGIGFALLIIPGVILLVFLSMAVPAFIIERRGVTDSMSRSWNLVSGKWWHVLGAILVAAIISGIVSGIIGALGGDSVIGIWLTSAIGSVITAPFYALVSVVLYVDLRARREGLDSATLQRELDTGTV
ncbi:MAG TPA: hypothetical protein VLA82_12180 [Actinomycetota bacterium]|nr:hypothetical protein [Actinomycetota bacterium]